MHARTRIIALLRARFVNSPLIQKETRFFNIPKTSIKFDPYVIAPFYEDEEITLDSMNEEVKVAFLYAHNLSMDAIGDRFKPKKHRYQVARLKFLKKYFRENRVTSHINRAMDISPIVEH